MKNETILTDDMKLDLSESLATLANGLVTLKRLFEKADTKLAEHATQIATQQRLLDSLEHRMEMLEATHPKGRFDA